MPIDNSQGLRGSVKVWFEQPAIAVTNISCDGEVYTYSVLIRTSTEVIQTGNVQTSIGLRSTPEGDYVWYAGAASPDFGPDTKEVLLAFTVDVPKDHEVYIKAVSVGGNTLKDQSSRHFDEYTPENDIPVITKTQCLMNA